MIPGINGILAGANTYPGIQLITTVSDLTNRGGSYTFTGVNFGPVYPNRTIIITTALQSGNAQTLNISTCTIGGLTASGSDTGEFGAGGPTVGAGIFAAKPTGTSGTIVVNFSPGTSTSCLVNVISVATNSSTATASYNITPGGGGRSSESSTINTPSNGVIIQAITRHNSNAITFTGATSRSQTFFDAAEVGLAFDEHLPSNASRSIGWSASSSTVTGYIVKTYQ